MHRCVDINSPLIEYRPHIVAASLSIVGIALGSLALVAYFKHWGMPACGSLAGIGGTFIVGGISVLVLPAIIQRIQEGKKSRKREQFTEKVALYCPQATTSVSQTQFAHAKENLAQNLYEKIKAGSSTEFATLLKRFNEDKNILHEVLFESQIFLDRDDRTTSIVENGPVRLGRTVFEIALLRNKDNHPFLFHIFGACDDNSVKKFVDQDMLSSKGPHPLLEALFSIQDTRLIELIFLKSNVKGFEALIEIAFKRKESSWLGVLHNDLRPFENKIRNIKDFRFLLITSNFPENTIFTVLFSLEPHLLKIFGHNLIRNSTSFNLGLWIQVLPEYEPFYLALQKGKKELALSLISQMDKKKIIPLNLHGDEKMSALNFTLVVARPSPEIVQKLIENGENPNEEFSIQKIDTYFHGLLEAKGYLTIPPLCYVAIWGYEDIIPVLLKKGADAQKALEILDNAELTVAAGRLRKYLS